MVLFPLVWERGWPPKMSSTFGADMLWLSWNPWTDCPPVVDLKRASPLEVCRSFENWGILQKQHYKVLASRTHDELVRKKVAKFYSFNIGKLYNTSGEHWMCYKYCQMLISDITYQGCGIEFSKSSLYTRSPHCNLLFLQVAILINSVPPWHPCFRKESNRSFCVTYVYSMTIYWPRAHEPPTPFYWPCKVIVPMIQAHKVAYKFHWCMVANEGQNPKFCNSPSNPAKSPTNEANPIPSITLASYLAADWMWIHFLHILLANRSYA